MGNACGCQTPEGGAECPTPTIEKVLVQNQKNSIAASVVPLVTQEDLDSDNDDDTDFVEDLPQPSAKAQSKNRQSVSAEAYGEWNKKGDFKAPVFPKSKDERERINEILLNSFLFNSLDVEDFDILLDAFEEVSIKKGETIIKQGDDGDKLYLIETGHVNVFKKMGEGEEPKLVSEMKAGEAFGELALMYNAPRAATVVSADDMKLWALDRLTFSHIVKDAASKKREMYEEALKEVQLLKDMDPYERSKVADALKTEKYAIGDVIIKEGDEGDIFYMILDGTADAIKEGKVVFSYKKGGCFGELALLKNQPRAATVKATSECRVAYMDRRSFKRLLGPVEAVLMRNQEHYRAVMKEMGLDTKYLDS